MSAHYIRKGLYHSGVPSPDGNQKNKRGRMQRNGSSTLLYWE